MSLAFRFSARLGLCPAADAERVAAHLGSVGLPTRISDVPGATFSAQELLAAMGQDKKVKAGQLTFILARGIGKSFVARGIEGADVLAFLNAELAQNRV
jgi:3-dehydroquinate synthetase